jgi:hypothetical protein
MMNGRSEKLQAQTAVTGSNLTSTMQIPHSCSFEDFLAKMEALGYEIKKGKRLSFRPAGKQRFARSDRIGADYSLEKIKERIENRTLPDILKSPTNKIKPFNKKINLLLELSKVRSKGRGYERWAQGYNLQEMAKTVDFITKNNISDYAELEEKADEATDKFNSVSSKIKEIESRASQNKKLQTQIINYAKTVEVYKKYKTLKGKDKADFYARHEQEILKHEAAKKAFDMLCVKKLPKAAALQSENVQLASEKKELYQGYQTLKKEMLELKTVLLNINRFLEIDNEIESVKKKKIETQI